MTTQIFEIEFIGNEKGFSEQLIGECIISTKNIISTKEQQIESHY